MPPLGAFSRYSHLWLLYGFRIGSDQYDSTQGRRRAAIDQPPSFFERIFFRAVSERLWAVLSSKGSPWRIFPPRFIRFGCEDTQNMCAHGPGACHSRYFEVARGPSVKTLCETGFNAGHSAAIWMNANPEARMFSFDLGQSPCFQD